MNKIRLFFISIFLSSKRKVEPAGAYINGGGIENQISLGHGFIALSADSERTIEVSAHFRHIIRNERVGDIQGEVHELDSTADMVGLAHLV